MFKIKKERVLGESPRHVTGTVEHAANVARENVIWLTAGIVVALIVGLAVGGFLWMRQQNDQAAAELLQEGTKVYAERAMAAPQPRRPEDIQRAVQVFRKVLLEFPRSAVAPQAAYMLGNALGDLRDWDGAEKAYHEFLTRYADHRVLVPLVYQRLAYAQLAQGKLEQAEQSFSAILKIIGGPNKDQALFELGKIDEILNRPEGALARYQEIIKVYPSSPFADEASVRVKTLDARKSSSAPAASPAPTQQPAKK